jgi:hypothetical protein
MLRVNEEISNPLSTFINIETRTLTIKTNQLREEIDISPIIDILRENYIDQSLSKEESTFEIK